LDSPFCFTAIMQKLWPGIGRMREWVCLRQAPA
jgi:hypothetical protein